MQTRHSETALAGEVEPNRLLGRSGETDDYSQGPSKGSKPPRGLCLEAFLDPSHALTSSSDDYYRSLCELIGFKGGEPGSVCSFYASVIRRLGYLTCLPGETLAHAGLQGVLISNTTMVLKEAEWRFRYARQAGFSNADVVPFIGEDFSAARLLKWDKDVAEAIGSHHSETPYRQEPTSAGEHSWEEMRIEGGEGF